MCHLPLTGRTSGIGFQHMLALRSRNDAADANGIRIGASGRRPQCVADANGVRIVSSDSSDSSISDETMELGLRDERPHFHWRLLCWMETVAREPGSGDLFRERIVYCSHCLSRKAKRTE